MKKSLVALAALSAISAFADVDVSGGIKLYGVLDQAYTHQSVARATLGTTMTTSDSATGFFSAKDKSRFGVLGERDLGEGLKAFIQFEAELAPQDASNSITTNRGTFVGMKSDSFGSVKAGYQETIAYEMDKTDANGRIEYKPQVWRLANATSPDRMNNAIRYTTPTYAGLSADIQRGYPKVTPYIPTGVFTSYGVNFAKDAFLIRFASDSYTGTALAPTLYGDNLAGVLASSATTFKLSTADWDNPLVRNTLAATYDFGSFKLNYLMANNAQSGAKGGSIKTNTFGVKVPYEKFVFALSVGSGNFATNDSNGTNVGSGSISDTTVGVYYSFDKSTTAYFLGSTGKTSVSTAGATNTAFSAGAAGSAVTSAFGLQYKF